MVFNLLIAWQWLKGDLSIPGKWHFITILHQTNHVEGIEAILCTHLWDIQQKITLVKLFIICFHDIL